jgi:hypothetical protein
MQVSRPWPCSTASPNQPSQAACSVSCTLEKVVDVYEKMTRAMPRFHEYMELFPRRIGLQDALVRIYKSYLAFSESTFKFLSRNVLREPLILLVLKHLG